MRLDDIDWRNESIRVPASKGRGGTVLPLDPAVGEAILVYLRQDRPSGYCREVFVRVRAPMGPLSGNLANIIRVYAAKAGLTGIPMGPHAWRHACATRMLAGGQGLKVIRDILGHRSIETTFIYTKVDVDALRQAALEWPGGEA
jgi:integrase/recombinase XerD